MRFKRLFVLSFVFQTGKQPGEFPNVIDFHAAEVGMRQDAVCQIIRKQPVRRPDALYKLRNKLGSADVTERYPGALPVCIVAEKHVIVDQIIRPILRLGNVERRKIVSGKLVDPIVIRVRKSRRPQSFC